MNEKTSKINTSQVIIFSARNKDRLQALISKMYNFIANELELSLANLAYTLQVGREAMTERIAIIVSSKQELLKNLQYIINQYQPLEDKIFIGNGIINNEEKIDSELVKTLLAKKSIEQLAKLWVNGTYIPWHELLREMSVRRIPLPGYPFLETEYNITMNPEKSKTKYFSSQGKRICIVGAGPSGLVMAKSLLEEGHIPVIYETDGELGGVWKLKKEKSSGVYKKTRFQNSKDTSFFSDFYPETNSLFLSTEEVLKYLHDYSDKFKLRDYIYFHSKVVSVHQGEEKKWLTKVLKNGKEILEIFDGIALCHGRYSVPIFPTIEAIEQFNGEVIHSGQYFDNQIFTGKRVLVVGNGVSGMDIAEDATETAKEVIWCMRSLKLILPRMVGFLPNDFVSPANLLIPGHIAMITQRLQHSMPEYYQLYKKSGLFPSIEEVMRYPFIHINDNVVKLVSQGAIKAIFGELERFVKNGCIITGLNKIIEADIIVFCTGYENERNFDYVKDVAIKDFAMGLFYNKNPTMVNSYGLSDVGTTGTFPFLEMVARWYAQIISGHYQLKIEELSYKVNETDIIVAPLANMMMGLKLNLLPDPAKRFKEFWRILNYPSFPLIYRLSGPHANPELQEKLDQCIQRSMIQDEQETPELRKIKYRILAGFENYQLEYLLNREEITFDDYQNALQVRQDALFLNWSIQYIKPKMNIPGYNSNKKHNVDKTLPTIHYDEFTHKLAELMSETIKLNKEMINFDDNLSSYGLSSVTLTSLATKILHAFPNIQLHPSIFLENPTLRKLSEVLYKKISNMTGDLLNEDMNKYQSNEKNYNYIDSVKVTGALPSAFIVNENINNPKKNSHIEELIVDIDKKQEASSKEKLTSNQKKYSVKEQKIFEDIAIIGIGGKFPKADNLVVFWKNLINDVPLITPIPADRWDWKTYYGDSKQENKTDCYHGSFIDGIKIFDPQHFGISAEDAKLMDPQQRLLLEVTWETLENAGYSKESLFERAIGFFIGVERQDYRDVIKKSGYPIDGYLNTGNTSSMLVNIVSHYFGWKGPNLAVNAACCSSFVALQSAINSIRCGQSEMALAGGVNLLLSSEVFIYNRKLGLFTNEDVVKPFDKSASGHFFAEAFGLVFLKRYSDAIHDGDNIYGIIKGISVRHGGQGIFSTAPNPMSHREVIQDALHQANLVPEDIDYIEAQGAANELSDVVELKAYHNIFSAIPDKQILIGAVTGHTGHFAGASGIVGLIKAILSLKNNHLIKVANFNDFNRSLDEEEFSCQILEETIYWQPKFYDGKPIPRRIGVHNFGFGGVTGHLILEEHCQLHSDSLRSKPLNGALIVLSARTKTQLKKIAEMLLTYITKKEYRYYGFNNINIHNIAYTLQICRQAMEERIVFYVISLSDLIKKLKSFAEGNTNIESCFYGSVGEGKKVIDCFSNHEPEKIIDQNNSQDILGLGKLWIQGENINWQVLYKEKNVVRKIALPTYPFLQESYWVGESGLTKKNLNQEYTVRETNCSDILDKFYQLYNTNEQYNLIQQYLCSILENVGNIQIEEIKPENALTQLGIDSLAWQSFREQLYKNLNFSLSVSYLLDNITIAKISEKIVSFLIKNSQKNKENESAILLQSASQQRYEQFLLTDIQEAFLVGGLIGNLGWENTQAKIYIEITEKKLNLEKLSNAWQRLIEYHDMLRVKIFTDGFQQILKQVPLYVIEVGDYSHLPESQIVDKLADVRKKILANKLETETWPLFEIRVSKLLGSTFIIHFCINELIADAESLGILLKQWFCLYYQLDISLPPLNLSFRDYAIHSKKLINSEAYKNALSYWLEKFKNMPHGQALSKIKNITGAKNYDILPRKRYVKILDEQSWTKLKEKSKELNITSTTLLFTVFSEILLLFIDEEKLAITLTYSGRPADNPEAHQIVGPFLSTLLFIVQSFKEKNLTEVSWHYQQQMWNAIEKSNVNSIQILRELKRLRLISSSLSIPVVFTSLLQNSANKNILDSPWFSFVASKESLLLTPQVYFEHQCIELNHHLYLIFDIAENYFLGDHIEKFIIIYFNYLQKLTLEDDLWIDLNSYHNYKESIISEIKQLNSPFIKEDLDSVKWIDSKHKGFEPFSLSDMQSSYLFSRMLFTHGKKTTSGQIYQEIKLSKLDVELFNKAFQKVINRHDMLRVIIYEEGYQKIQKNLPDYTMKIKRLDNKNNDQVSRYLQEERNRLVNKVFPLGQWPFFEVYVSILFDQTVILHFSFDFMIADVHSINIILRDLFYFYNSFDKQLPKLEFSYCDYLYSLQKYETTREYQLSIKYWREKFLSMPSGPALPFVTNGVNPQYSIHTRRTAKIDNWRFFERKAAELKVSLGIIFLTIYVELIATFSREQSFTLVVVNWDRLPIHPEIDNVVGDFTRLSWLIYKTVNQSFINKIMLVNELWYNDKKHEKVSGLKELRKVIHQQGKNGLSFPIVFTNLASEVNIFFPEGSEIIYGISQTAKVYLDAIIEKNNHGLYVHFDSVDAAFSDKFVSKLFDSYIKIIKNLSENEEDWHSVDIMRSELIEYNGVT